MYCHWTTSLSPVFHVVNRKANKFTLNCSPIFFMKLSSNSNNNHLAWIIPSLEGYLQCRTSTKQYWYFCCIICIISIPFIWFGWKRVTPTWPSHFSLSVFLTFSYLLFILAHVFHARKNKYVWHFRIMYQWNIPDSSISSPLICALPLPHSTKKKRNHPEQKKKKVRELLK